MWPLVSNAGSYLGEGLKWGFTNIGVPLFSTWAARKLVGNSGSRGQSSTSPTRGTSNPVVDASPGTINTNDSNRSDTSANSTLLIGAVALIAVVMISKKK
jgi:hypothetical protein